MSIYYDTNDMKHRKAEEFIKRLPQSPDSRIIVLTGARQTGKTTLARELFPDFQFLSIEDPILRQSYAQLSAAQWKAVYPQAILDEVQKEPRLIESVKSVFDQWPEPRYVLTGSSQLLLLEKVRESLAGRCVIVDLYPLTLPELRTEAWDDPARDSPFQAILKTPVATSQTVQSLLPHFLLDPRHPDKMKAWNHYCLFGGYPALTNPDFGEEDRHRWLSQYVRTYLERDVRDLSALRDLEPFIRLQRYVAYQSGRIVNVSEIAKQVGVSAKTVQKYLRYMELSYQVLLLRPWHRNNAKRLVKSPKLHMFDHGVLQAVLQKRGLPFGLEFESLVVAELYKQAQTIFSNARFFHLRTVDGREVDLLVELPEGYLAFEIKSATNVDLSDARHLRSLADLLDKPLLHSFVLSLDMESKRLAPDITAVHAGYFLG